MPNRLGLFAAFLALLACCSPHSFAADEYKPHPDSIAQEGVPKGTVTKHVFASSKIFPGTTRAYSVYVPAQYKKEEPACVMIFQDGGGGLSVPTVFDNLIHR
jgi:gluconolactonase